MLNLFFIFSMWKLIVNILAQCGETSFSLSKEIKEFKSPNYDNGFIPNGLRCIYYFSVNDSDYNFGRVLLRFLDMDLGPTEIKQPCTSFVKLTKNIPVST